MTDEVNFIPLDFGRTGAAPTVGLGTSLFVLRATMRHPVSGADVKLPPHVWAMYHVGSGRIAVVSKVSDANGVCAINRPEHAIFDRFALALYPAPDAVRAEYIKRGEAWIDLDTNDWVQPSPDPTTALEKRRLWRVPVWTTTRKAKRGGGFKEAPPAGRDDFLRTGALRDADLAPYGSLASPWEMPLDHGWVRVKAQFKFFDWNHNQEQILPPGLILEATADVLNADGIPSRRRVGGGTPVKRGDSTFTLVLEGDRDVWKTCHFTFRAPPRARVDLSGAPPAAGAPDDRMTIADPVPVDPNVRNSLPPQWHSLGMSARATIGGATKGPKRWEALRGEVASDGGSLDASVEFHLDDVVLADGDGEAAKVKPGARPALFDHYLAIRIPDAHRSDISDVTLDGPVIPAAKAFSVGGATGGHKVLEISTRLVHLRGKLYDLRDDRLGGTPGRTPGLGARAAFRDRHPHVDYLHGNPKLKKEGFYSIHFIDVPAVTDPKTGKQLQHLMMFVATKVQAEKGVDPARVPELFTLLTDAAERWSQGHPCLGASPSKDYVAVPKDAAKRGHHVTRLRYYFGETDQDQHLDITLKKDPDPRGAGRSSVEPERLYFFGRNMTYFDTAVSRDMRARGGGGAGDSDGIGFGFNTLAHEFGHVLGLPDEYYECVDPGEIDPALSLRDPRLPSFDQIDEGWGKVRPFYSDGSAMMVFNQRPRMHHVRHHVEAFNAESAFDGAPDRPYVVRHEAFAGGLDHTMPAAHDGPTYLPEIDGEKLTGGRGDATLYALGADEASAEAMFRAPGAFGATPLAARPDGVLVLRLHLRFVFDAAIRPFDQGSAMMALHDAFFDARYAPKFRFCLEGGSKLSRIAVLFHPHYARGDGPMLFDAADLVLKISKSPTPAASPFTRAGLGSEIALDVTQLDAKAIVRAWIGAATFIPSPAGPIVNPAPVLPPELNRVADFVDAKLGDRPGTRVVRPL